MFWKKETVADVVADDQVSIASRWLAGILCQVHEKNTVLEQVQDDRGFCNRLGSVKRQGKEIARLAATPHDRIVHARSSHLVQGTRVVINYFCNKLEHVFT